VIEIAAALTLATAAGALLASYVVYPLVAIGWGRRRAGARPAAAGAAPFEPRVSFIICAFNEERAIRAKLENTLGLDYPADRLEVIVASDASTDATNALVAGYGDSRVRLCASPERRGKTTTTVLAVEAARGEILVFSDATGVFNREALRALVAPFSDPGVGAVSGRVTYRYGDTATARGFQLYQRWVVAQRRAEPGLHTLTSVSGSIHAVRRDAFEAVPAQLSYDMVQPALLAMRGLRALYAPDATSLESSRLSPGEEFSARLRIAVRAYSFLAWLWQERARIQDRRYLAQLLFHKVLRWFTPHLLALALVSHVLLAVSGGRAALLLIPHVSAYALAAALLILGERARFPGSSALVLFATVNAAYAVGFARFVRGTRMAAWTPDRS
jgi:cellulose synthase/poly-beta-1,6-N-acetylglucosamine synthase-like glycosyltransferase